MFGYQWHSVYKILEEKTYKDEIERQAIFKLCLSFGHASHHLLINKLYQNKIEFLKLKYRALRDSETCVKLITLNPEFLNKDEMDIAWEIAIENPNSCLELLEFYFKHIPTSKFIQYKQDLIDTSILLKDNIVRTLYWINDEEKISVLNKFLYNQTLVFLLEGYFRNNAFKLNEECRKLLFSLILNNDYICYRLAKSESFTEEELTIAVKKYGSIFYKTAIEESKDEKDLNPLTTYFKVFKKFVRPSQEKYFVKKIKSAKKYQDEIDNIIKKGILSKDAVDDLEAFKLANFLVNK